ncbi:hypothetical protein KUV28_11975 [Ferrimonas balearica]|nr:hypothetical protein [Ferrimonas balearica]
MFRNDGYINACRLREAFSINTLRKTNPRLIEEAAAEQFRHQGRARAEGEQSNRFMRAPTMSAAKEAGVDTEVRSRAASRMAGAFRRFLMHQQLYLCGPDQAVVPVSIDIVSPLTNAPYRKLSYYHEWDFLEDRFLSVSARRRLDLIDAARTLLGAESELGLGRTVSDRLKRLLTQEPAISALLQYEGYFLAVEKEVVGSNLASLVDDYLWPLDKIRKERADRDSPGRPRKVDDAMLAYERLFPVGHSCSWKEACRALKQEADIEVSVDTLKRAVRKLQEVAPSKTQNPMQNKV